jgi:tight adherence protein C
MFAGSEMFSMGVFVLVFAGIWVAAYLIFWRAYGDDARAIARLRGLSSEGEPRALQQTPRLDFTEWVRSALPRLGALMLPQGESGTAQLRSQLAQAGLYQANAAKVFLGAKLALMGLLLLLCGLLPFLAGVVPLPWAMVLGALASAAGLLGPNVWLHSRIRRRQRELLRALPDFLDMLVLCLEGGLSLTAALPRVVGEMLQVHPTLGEEMTITQQTANLGLSAGDAFKQFAARCGLAPVRDLASVVLQSERFGASLVKTLRTHADAYRIERQQRAEEQAQKAAVKVLFPMLLFIFPAIFIVLLGPAAFQIAQLFSK